jgi:hypothetical protein
MKSREIYRDFWQQNQVDPFFRRFFEIAAMPMIRFRTRLAARNAERCRFFGQTRLDHFTRAASI